MQNKSKLIPALLFDDFVPPLKCGLDDVVSYAIHKSNSIIPKINKHYKTNIIKVEGSLIKPFKQLQCGCGIFKYQWNKINNSSFVGYIPLKTFNDESPFDIETDVYGGQLIMTQYKTSLKPAIGQLCVFPSTPNFAHYFNDVTLGNLDIIKLLFICETKYQFNYEDWSVNWRF